MTTTKLPFNPGAHDLNLFTGDRNLHFFDDHDEILQLLELKQGEGLGCCATELCYTLSDLEVYSSPWDITLEAEHNAGDGNNLVFVFRVVHPQRPDEVNYFMFSGYYSSWSESEIQEIVLVKPLEKTVTTWLNKFNDADRGWV